MMLLVVVRRHRRALSSSIAAHCPRRVVVVHCRALSLCAVVFLLTHFALRQSVRRRRLAAKARFLPANRQNRPGGVAFRREQRRFHCRRFADQITARRFFVHQTGLRTMNCPVLFVFFFFQTTSTIAQHSNHVDEIRCFQFSNLATKESSSASSGVFLLFSRANESRQTRRQKKKTKKKNEIKLTK